MNRRTLVGMVSLVAVLGSAAPLWADGSVRFTGTLTLAIDRFDLGAFGFLGSEVPVGGAPLPTEFQSYFSVTFIGGGDPDPSNLPAILEDFDLTIGNAHWDETMPYTDLRVLAQGDTVLGIQAFLTDTRPDHPDLKFLLPSSPGTWEAHDLIGTTDHGIISGTYSISGTAVPVPEPASLALGAFGLAGVALGARRRRAGMSGAPTGGIPERRA